MAKSPVAVRFALSFVLVISLAVGQVGYVSKRAIAADAKQVVSPKVAIPLQAALEAAKAGKLADALINAQEAAGISGKTPYENFVVNQVITGLYVRMKDYANAMISLEAELATGEMSGQESNAALRQIAFTYYSLKNYPKVVEVGSRYLKEADANDIDMLMVVAQAEYLQKNFQAASDGIRTLIKAAQTTNKPVKEDWLQLLTNSEQQQGDDASVVATLEQLIAVDPKEEYWKQLIAYIERFPEFKSDSSSRTALDLYFVKFALGIVTTPDEYARMVQLALHEGLPGAAKKVIDQEMSAGVLSEGDLKDREMDLLAKVKTQVESDQKALLSGEAEARKAKTGDPLVDVGEAYWSYGQYDKAVDAIQAGIAKGVTNADDAKLRLGIVYLAAGKRNEADDHFKTISSDCVPGKLSQLWMLASTSPPPSASTSPP